MDYKEAGVDIDQATETLKNLKDIIKSTFTENVVQNTGKFGGFFKIDENRILVASVDGVGTKVKTAKMAGRLEVAGQDIVNHCVNDIAVHNATPLFFLDYVATSKLRNEDLTDVITGISKACRENHCALIGGETAEMPGVYNENMLDIAGAIVGILNKDEIIDGREIKKGNVLIGIESNGPHTNGYSLINKLFFENNKFDINQHIEELNDTLANQLLTTHKSYFPLIRNLARQIDINGIAHITGGGLYENTMRIIPEGMGLDIDYDKIEVLPIFNYIQKLDDIDSKEMFRVFNMGVGLVIISGEKNLEKIKQKSEELLNKKAYIIGKVK